MPKDTLEAQFEVRRSGVNTALVFAHSNLVIKKKVL